MREAVPVAALLPLLLVAAFCVSKLPSACVCAPRQILVIPLFCAFALRLLWIERMVVFPLWHSCTLFYCVVCCYIVRHNTYYLRDEKISAGGFSEHRSDGECFFPNSDVDKVCALQCCNAVGAQDR